ncbi:glycosyltransferase [Pseudoalteromonas sp. SG43-5]|nr:glycosyltransferase [Pseudoalteromonas sp. SG43-5]
MQLLAEKLAEKGHEVHIACTVPKDSKNAKTCSVINGVKVHYIPLVNFYWPFDEKHRGPSIKLAWHLLDTYNPFMMRQIRALVKNIMPDVIHTNNLSGFSAGVLSCLGGNGTKLVHTARDYYFLHPNCTLMKGKQQLNGNSFSIKFWSYLRGRFLKNVDSFISISTFVKKLHCSHFDFLTLKSKVVFNPTGTLNLLKKNREGKSIPKYGFIGRLSEEKGFEDFVKLAEHFAIIKSGAKFVAAGKGDNEYVEKLLTSYPDSNIDFLGFVDPSSFYESVDILVSPTVWPEPFGRTIIEARSAGVLVIAYPVGGISEIFHILNESEFLVENYKELLELTLSLSFGELNIKEKTHQEFSIVTHCNMMECIYNA